MKRNSDTRLAPPLARRQASDLAPQRPANRQTRFQRFATGFRNHPLTVCIETLGLLGLIFAVIFFFYDLKERQDERIARSWQLLTTPAPGNSGKREALEYLNSVSMFCIENTLFCFKDRISLKGVDLSSKTHGGAVNLHGINLKGADLEGANFSGAIMSNSILDDTYMAHVDLSNTNLSGVSINNSYIVSSNFNGAKARTGRIDFTHIISSSFNETIFIDFDVSTLYLSDNWAWTDRPPRSMHSEIASRIKYRDPTQRNEAE